MIFKLIDVLNEDEKEKLLKGISSKVESYKEYVI